VKKVILPSEGAIFLVPLSHGGHGVGVLVRADGEGRAYGLFFGPTVDDPGRVDAAKLVPETAILRCKFGDHGVVTGRWRVIGQIAPWDRHRWSLPPFARRHDNPALRYVSEYDDELNLRSERIVVADEAVGMPEDAQFGSAVVEAKLDALLH
jgi:Immunity protein 26